MKRLFLALSVALLAAGAAAAANPVVEIDTSMGKIKVELDEAKAPITVKNFLSYVDDKFYDGVIFHRVISDFMIQGGGFTREYKEKDTKASIKNEGGNGLSNKRGTIAMARTPDPDSASAQWFINHKDNAGLDRANARDRFGYAVFGKVVEGMDVVDKIAGVRTGVKEFTPKGGKKTRFEDVPAEDVVIKSIRRLEK